MKTKAIRDDGQFVFTPYAEWLLHKQVWMEAPASAADGLPAFAPDGLRRGERRGEPVPLHALPDRKFIVRRTTNPTKFNNDDFR